MEFKDYFIIIWAIGMISIPFIYWREGHNTFWQSMREIFSFSGLQEDFPNTNNSAETFFYRERNKKWKSWNLFNINFNEHGIYIRSIFTSAFFPTIFIPWHEIQIKEVAKYRLQKRILLSFKSYDGELYIPARHERVINHYVC